MYVFSINKPFIFNLSFKSQITIKQSQSYYTEEFGNSFAKKYVQSNAVTLGNDTFKGQAMESETLSKEDIFPLAKRYVDDKGNSR